MKDFFIGFSYGIVCWILFLNTTIGVVVLVMLVVGLATWSLKLRAVFSSHPITTKNNLIVIFISTIIGFFAGYGCTWLF